MALRRGPRAHLRDTKRRQPLQSIAQPERLCVRPRHLVQTLTDATGWPVVYREKSKILVIVGAKTERHNKTLQRAEFLVKVIGGNQAPVIV